MYFSFNDPTNSKYWIMYPLKTHIEYLRSFSYTFGVWAMRWLRLYCWISAEYLRASRTQLSAGVWHWYRACITQLNSLLRAKERDARRSVASIDVDSFLLRSYGSFEASITQHTFSIYALDMCGAWEWTLVAVPKYGTVVKQTRADAYYLTYASQ